MSVMTPVAWCELPGRTADLEIKSPSIAEAAKLANVNGELAKLNAMAARRDKRNSSIKLSDSDWIPHCPTAGHQGRNLPPQVRQEVF